MGHLGRAGLAVFLTLNCACARTTAVDTIFSGKNAQGPGCALAAIKDGHMVLDASYGLANLEDETSLSTRTQFDMASVSKQIVAALVAVLILDKQVSIDERLSKYVTLLPQYADEVTVRHLLSHMSGIRDYTHLMILSGLDVDEKLSKSDLLRLIADQSALNFEPGSKYEYSNSNYILLVELIEEQSGSSLNDFANARLFGPAGMKNSYFMSDASQPKADRATEYVQGSSGWEPIASQFSVPGARGLISTPLDLLKWHQALYESDFGAPILSILREPGPYLNRTDSYGAGMMMGTYRRGRTEGHSGGGNGRSSYLVRLPDSDFTVSVACNSSDMAQELAFRAIDALLFGEPRLNAASSPSGKAKRKTVHLPPDSVQPLLGTYHIDESMNLAIFMQGEQVYAQATGQPAFAIFPESDKRFFYTAVEADIEFFTSESGSVDSLILTSPKGRRPGTKQHYVDPHLTLKNYSGNYTCEDLLADHALVARDGALWWRVANSASVPLTRLDAETFLIRDATLEFNRNGNGIVAGYSLATSRVNGLTCERIDI